MGTWTRTSGPAREVRQGFLEEVGFEGWMKRKQSDHTDYASGMGSRDREVRGHFGNSPEVGTMGTKDGEEAGGDQAEGHRGASTPRAEGTLRILSKDRALSGKEEVF